MSLGRVLATAAISLTLCGCGKVDQARSLRGYPVDHPTLSIAEALAAPERPVLVRGRLGSSYDDRMHLCTRLDERRCVSPSLLVVGLDVQRVRGLKEGCCSIGYWSPHELAVRGTVIGGVLYVAADTP